MYSKMPQKTKNKHLFGFGWPSIMTAKSFVRVSNFFEATRFAVIDISKLDVMLKVKC